MNTVYSQFPKIELHLHLEGAIPHEILLALIQKYEPQSTVKTVSDLEKKFTYQNFNEFVQTWQWKNQYLREEEDFRFIAKQVALDLQQQNVRYAEMFVSPSAFKALLPPQRMIEAVRQGLDEAEDIKINLIVDFVRDYGKAAELKTLEEIKETKDFGVIGIGLGGAEQDYPAELFRDLFIKARKYGFKTNAHAGEVAGPESIWSALKVLKVDRIGHGVRAAEDEKLLDYLQEHRVPIELCPLSNMSTGVISKAKQMPIAVFLERGIPFSINTDDPKMFGNSLEKEYAWIARHFHLRPSQLHEIIVNSIHTTWLEEEEKKELLEDFMQFEVV